VPNECAWASVDQVRTRHSGKAGEPLAFSQLNRETFA
jgi:hypothetical protein